MRRHFTDVMKRQIRQNCRFGCVICGLPIFQYDHIEDFAKGGETVVENGALLCPSHHQDKSSGRLSASAVRHALAKPANSDKVHTAPHFHLAVGGSARFVLGGVVFESEFAKIGDQFAAIHLHGRTVLGVTHDAGNLLFDLQLTDEIGNLVLVVNQGELIAATGVWDFRIEGRTLVIQAQQGRNILKLDFDELGFSISEGLIVVPPTTVKIFPDRVVINSAMVSNMVMHGGAHITNCRSGIHFG